MDLLRYSSAIVFAIELFLLSLLIHELGHAAAIRITMGRNKIQEIRVGSWTIVRKGLFKIGVLPTWGYVMFAEDQATPEIRRIIAVAGPVASALAAALFELLSILEKSPHWAMVMHTMALANLAICGFNLIPVPPLDGWKVIETYLPTFGIHLSKRQRATMYQWGSVIVIVGSCLAVVFFGPYHGS